MCSSKINKRLGCWSPRRKHRCSRPKNGYAFFGCKNSALTSPKVVSFSDEVYMRKGPAKLAGVQVNWVHTSLREWVVVRRGLGGSSLAAAL